MVSPAAECPRPQCRQPAGRVHPQCGQQGCVKPRAQPGVAREDLGVTAGVTLPRACAWGPVAESRGHDLPAVMFMQAGSWLVGMGTGACQGWEKMEWPHPMPAPRTHTHTHLTQYSTSHKLACTMPALMGSL